MENNLYGLTYGCPYLQRNEDCPFREVDNLLFKGKVIWIERKSTKESKTIFEHNKSCSKNR